MNVRTLSVIFNFFLIVLAFAAMNVAQAQEVQVNSAKPNSANQGAVDLDVEISGSGFDNSAAVDFFVTGTTNPGGITVKKVKVRGSKKIIATIDVDSLADVADFDIEVRLSSGRNGKGTTLFLVLKADQTAREEAGPTYSVTFSAPILGDSGTDLWVVGSTNSIQYGTDHLTMDPTTIDLSFFTATHAGGNTCFADGNGGQIFTPFGAGIGQGKRGRAEADFWLIAQTAEGIPVKYLLQTVGFFKDIPSSWLPSVAGTNGTATLQMVSWDMVLVNGQPELRSSSCLSEGLFSLPEEQGANDWLIDVTLN